MAALDKCACRPSGHPSPQLRSLASPAYYFLGVPVRSGLLFYLKTGEVSHVVASWDDVRHLIQQRNMLATHLIVGETLPPMLQSAHVCGRCYQADACMVAHKVHSGPHRSCPPPDRTTVLHPRPTEPSIH